MRIPVGNRLKIDHKYFHPQLSYSIYFDVTLDHIGSDTASYNNQPVDFRRMYLVLLLDISLRLQSEFFTFFYE
jgi:hypothetical protein